MKTIISINEKTQIELDDFNSCVDLSIHFQLPQGQWVCTGSVVLHAGQSAALAIALLNRVPDAHLFLKTRFLKEENRRKKAARRKVRPILSLAATLGGLAESTEPERPISK